MSTKTLRLRIESEFNEKKLVVIKRMSVVDNICLTADIWSSRGRSFMGVTGHWLQFAKTSTEVERISVVLALRRFPGSHSFDRIGEMLHGILMEYKIKEKVVCVVTDNGSNFVKAFNKYGRDFAKDQSRQSVSVDYAEFDEGSDNEEYIEPDEFPSAECVNNPRLPPHVRCACHTLSLIATKNIEMVYSRFNSKILYTYVV